MTRNMPQDTALSIKQLIILDTSLDAKSHAVTRIAWSSPASRTKHSWSFPLHAGTHLIRGDALSHRAVLGRAAASRHGSPQPSSDAEASTDRAPRPAVWASTALSSGRVAVRGAGATGGKRGAAGRAGASRGRQPLPTSPREAAGEGSGGHRRRREAREALKSGPGASRHPSGGAGWAQELIQDFKVIHYT